jgi:hypothetical protein
MLCTKILGHDSDVSAAMPRKEVTTLTPEYVFILETAYFSRLHSWSRLSNFIALDLGKEQIIIHNYYQYYSDSNYILTYFLNVIKQLKGTQGLERFYTYNITYLCS